jgi:hypothetical protein
VFRIIEGPRRVWFAYCGPAEFGAVVMQSLESLRGSGDSDPAEVQIF